MQSTTIIEKEKVKVRGGVLITGLPGIGMIGNIVGRHMVEALKTQRIANLYSPHFPHQVFMGKQGGLRLIKNNIYRVKEKPIFILLGDVQAISSLGQYEVADAIIQYAKKIGVKTIITVGGYSTGRINEERQIFGAVTHKSMIKKWKRHRVLFGKARGSIVGAAGLLPALGRLKGLEGICIMGETHGGYVDATAAKNIVSLLSRYFGMPIDIKKLEQKAKESEKVLKKIEEEIQKNVIVNYEPTKRSVSYIR